MACFVFGFPWPSKQKQETERVEFVSMNHHQRKPVSNNSYLGHSGQYYQTGLLGSPRSSRAQDSSSKLMRRKTTEEGDTHWKRVHKMTHVTI